MLEKTNAHGHHGTGDLVDRVTVEDAVPGKSTSW